MTPHTHTHHPHHTGMYCPKLEVLDISGVSLTTTSFNLLTQRCNGLTVRVCVWGVYGGDRGGVCVWGCMGGVCVCVCVGCVCVGCVWGGGGCVCVYDSLILQWLKLAGCHQVGEKGFVLII